MQNIFYKFKANFIGIFSGKNLYVHLLAILLTVIVVNTGLDSWYFSATRDPALQALLIPAAMIGGLLPILLPLYLYFIGKITKNKTFIHTAYAVIQAVMMGWIISSSYKAFTGRAHPNIHNSALFSNIANNQIINVDTLSREFHFGILDGGIFWGWPSSHTAVAFSIALTLWMLFRKNRAVKFIAIAIAAYIGISVSTNIHWLSDGIAGALIGSIIGIQIGKSYLERAKGQQ
ncbi:MAG: phosphatase PAP2 family protein [Candidatus Peregrinibacteria bacterium]|nr:phosphatase PAP2 family protein [Candidatus Peregrinibacteria bacterium]